ncbi:hypothetical protein [Aeromicrobium sp.]|uniref:hypothetical protein n=1 Tax=Aeromicrobium sp. TaxID=1871063 RepID=UPI0019867FF7|nr:hypothetical protein [Aeromicrobium sp.]MBC7631500.1 hypothetical protein [Aeromicrobium sp.]
MDPEARFDEIVDELAPRGVLPGALFGSRSLTYEGKAFASFRGERLAVKLVGGSATHTEALALDGVQPFDPSGKGRPLKDWVAVPASQGQAWPRLTEAALAAVLGQGGA